MNLKRLLTMIAVYNVSLGFGALLAPALAIATYEIVPSPPILAVVQNVGVHAGMFGVLAWLARPLTNREALRAISLTLFAKSVLSVGVTALAITSSAKGATDWAFVGFEALFAVGLWVYGIAGGDRG